MRSQKRSTKVVRLLGLLLILSFFPSSGYSQSRWWQRSDEGWFFYHDPPKGEKKEEENEENQFLPDDQNRILELKEENEEKPIQATPPKASLQRESLEIPQPPPAPLFTEILKKKGEEVLSRAIENPTVENVKAYIEHNNLMIKLSENFSIAWQKALMIYPELQSPVPTSDADKDIYFRVEREKERDILYELSREAGLFFFYSASCPYCERQARHLKRFLSEYPFFIVKPVTMDGGVFEEFPETVPDNGISVRVGVEKVPAIFLAFPPDRFERISTGLLTAEELKRRLILYAKKIDIPYPDTYTGD
jgi:conjugal transfer pilus assembly protein TraF